MNISVADLVVSVATAADAPGMVDVIHAAFGARPPLDPPSTAIEETPASIEAQLAAGGGIYATVDGAPAGSILLHPDPERPGLVSWHRVSVHPAFQRHGIATAMVDAALDYAAELGFVRSELFAREEITELIAFWQHRGFAVDRPARNGVVLARSLPLAVDVPTAERMQDLGVRLAGLLRPGDLVIASGDLGAGKTTLTQGIGRGLDSEGAVISPTFVLSRIHPSRSAGRSWCTSTPTGSPAPKSSTTSTSTPRPPTPSPWSSGAPAWPRDSPTTGWRSTSVARPTPAAGPSTRTADWSSSDRWGSVGRTST